MNVIFGKQKWERGDTFAVSNSKQGCRGSGFLCQCSGGPRIWYLLLWVPGTSILMMGTWTDAMCLEPAIGAPISLFPSFLIIPQFSDHGTGNSYLGWQSFLEDQTGDYFPRLSNNFINIQFFILNLFSFSEPEWLLLLAATFWMTQMKPIISPSLLPASCLVS